MSRRLIIFQVLPGTFLTCLQEQGPKGTDDVIEKLSNSLEFKAEKRK